MNQILTGVELFFTADQIRERLQQREQKRQEEAQEQHSNFLKDLEEQEFNYSELSAEEIEEEIKMYTEDMKKIRKALADKKKEKDVK